MDVFSDSLNGTYKHPVSMPDWTCKAKTTKVRLREGGGKKKERRKERKGKQTSFRLWSG